MSPSSLTGKLQPAKKVLKRFTKAVQSKFQNLDLRRAIKVFQANTSRFLAYCSLHFFIPLKKRSITKPPYRSQQFYHLHQCYRHKNQLHKNLSPIYIDQLYGAEPGSVHANHFHARAETSNGGKEVVQEKVLPRQDSKAREKSLCSVEDAWREVVARSPQLRPVDERAEEFIYKVHEERKLQKERSVLEFEEMLTRSA